MVTTTTPTFHFNFYRFIENNGKRTTERVRDFQQADIMRALVDSAQRIVTVAVQRVQDWASTKNLTVEMQEPFPSNKHQDKVWLEFRIGGLTL